MPEFKSFPYAVKGIEDRAVTGIVSVFGTIDEANDRIWPGAFSKTIAERRSKFRHLWGHDFSSPPIASIDDIKEVTRAELPQSVLNSATEATGGLEVTRTYLDTPRGNEVLAGLKAGAITEMSFGFDTITGKLAFTDLEDGRRIRELYELRLFDTSDVLWGMNGNTAAVSKALHMPLDELLKQLQIVADELKVGNRHSTQDYAMIDNLHDLAAKLGARTCKGILTDDDKSKTLKKLSELRPSNTRKRQEPVAITGLWLRALGNSVQACVEIDEKWRLAIDEMVVAEIEGIVSHICEPLGMRNAPLLDDTGKSDQSRAESSSLTLIQTRQRYLTSALALFGDY
jgi:HK97 family phage prohead protease